MSLFIQCIIYICVYLCVCACIYRVRLVRASSHHTVECNYKQKYKRGIPMSIIHIVVINILYSWQSIIVHCLLFSVLALFLFLFLLSLVLFVITVFILLIMLILILFILLIPI